MHSGHFFERRVQEIRTRNGVRLSVQTIGFPVHQPLMLLHGEWQSGNTFLEPSVLTALQDHRYLIIPDMRGHGASSKPLDRDAYTLDHFVSDLEDLLRFFALPPAMLYSASLLGQAILHAYLQRGHTPRPCEVVCHHAAITSYTAEELSQVASPLAAEHYAALRLLLLKRTPFPSEAAVAQALAPALLVPQAACEALRDLFVAEIAPCDQLARHHITSANIAELITHTSHV